MSYQQIIESFIAFHINSFHSLMYLFQTNMWMIFSTVGALSIIVMSIREEIEDLVTEEQNII